MSDFVGYFLFFLFVIAVILGIAAVTGTGNEYKERGELYQCFIDGKALYKSNVRPEYRGDNWYEVNGEVKQFDECFCMGCIGF